VASAACCRAHPFSGRRDPDQAEWGGATTAWPITSITSPASAPLASSRPESLLGEILEFYLKNEGQMPVAQPSAAIIRTLSEWQLSKLETATAQRASVVIADDSRLNITEIFKHA